MTTQAQVLANRLNAQKSTGPRTAEGKTAVSQNAVTHGLSGRLDVIKGEDPAEFDLFRAQMLGELAPAGPVEAVLAERIVSLSWRLQRVERMQSETFDALLTPDLSNPLMRLTQSILHKRSAGEAGDGEGASELALGRMVIKDFANNRVLDRLLMYERRIEHSLYRTMAELHRLRLLRGLDDTPQEVGRGRPTLDQVEGRLYQEPLAGVTTNAPAGAEKSCKTKPMAASANQNQVLDNKEVTEDFPAESRGETKPISACCDACGPVPPQNIPAHVPNRKPDFFGTLPLQMV